MFLLLLEFFPNVILITWGLESGLAKFFLQNLFLYGKLLGEFRNAGFPCFFD